MRARLLAFLTRPLSKSPPQLAGIRTTTHHLPAMAAPPPRTRLYDWVDDEVEDLEQYTPGGYHPVDIGDTVHDGRYRIVHKLGFGAYSTVWLARDTQKDRLVSLKFLRAGVAPSAAEIGALKLLNSPGPPHPGRSFILTLLNLFEMKGANGTHRCIVTEAVGPSVAAVKYESPGNRLPADIARRVAAQCVLALEYVHLNGIIHGDLHTGNILLKIPGLDTWTDEQVYARFGDPETYPITRTDGQPAAPAAPQNVVLSPPPTALMPFCLTATCSIRLADFGEALLKHTPGDRPRHTPLSIAAPETLLLDPDFGTPIDVWALACTLFEVLGDHRLLESYMSDRDEVLVDMVRAFGRLPERWWGRWENRGRFFEDGGEFKGDVEVPKTDLRERVAELVRGGDEGAKREFEGEREALVGLLGGMVRYEPAERLRAAEVVEMLPAGWKEMGVVGVADEGEGEYED